MKILKLNKRTLTITAVALLFVGTGSAALLTSFGTVTGTSDVDQALTFVEDGEELTEIEATYNDSTFVAGNTETTSFQLKNRADQPLEVVFTSQVDGTEATSFGGISTEVDATTEAENAYTSSKFVGTQAPSDNLTLADEAEFRIEYEDGYAVLTADIPRQVGAEDLQSVSSEDVNSPYTFGNLAATFDSDADGAADFQITYNGDGGAPGYQEYDGGWSDADLPGGIEHSADPFTLKVPQSMLGGENSQYKVAFQSRYGGSINGFDTNNAGISFPVVERANVFNYEDDYDGDSQKYLDQRVGQVTVDDGETMDFELDTHFNVLLEPGTYTVNTDVVPVSQVGQ